MLFKQLYQKIDQIIKNIEKNLDLIKQQDFQSKQLYSNVIESIEDISNKIIELQNNYDFITKELTNLETTTEKYYKEIIDIREKLYRLDWEPNQNIKQRLQNIASMETAQFIIKNMNSVPALNVTLNILDLAFSKCTIEGLIMEFGVYSGRTINHMANLTNKTIYGFDSFEGLPEDWRSGFEKGTFKTNCLPDVNENVRLIKGLFNDTLPNFLKEHQQICALIHIDCDLYSSTKCIFDSLKDRIVSGTVIVFDEYFNYPGWQTGEFKAFHEFINETNLKFKYIGYVEISEQVAVKIL